MKKYSTSEAIAMLEKNPKLEFKCTQGNTGMYDTISVNHGRICWNGDNKYPMYIVVKESLEWELIQQPVDFITAAKAYSEGKTIRCEDSKWKTRIYEPCEFSSEMRDTGGIAVSWEEILYGTWYVEDSNE